MRENNQVKITKSGEFDRFLLKRTECRHSDVNQLIDIIDKKKLKIKKMLARGLLYIIVTGNHAGGK